MHKRVAHPSGKSKIYVLRYTQLGDHDLSQRLATFNNGPGRVFKGQQFDHLSFNPCYYQVNLDKLSVEERSSTSAKLAMLPRSMFLSLSALFAITPVYGESEAKGYVHISLRRLIP